MKYIITLFFVILTLTIIGSYSNNVAYKKGYYDGIERGLDTVNTIINNHTKEKDSLKVARIIIVHPDTDIYILSKKTINFK